MKEREKMVERARLEKREEKEVIVESIVRECGWREKNGDWQRRKKDGKRWRRNNYGGEKTERR